MKISPAMGLLITVVLLLALFFCVPGYDEWFKELIK